MNIQPTRGRKKLYLIIIAFLALSGRAAAQDNTYPAEIERLLRLVPNLSRDSVGVRVLDSLASDYLSIDPKEALKWAQEEKKLAQEIDWQKGIAFAHSNIGLYHRETGNYAKALKHFDTAKAIMVEIGQEDKIGELLLNIGSVYLYQKNYEDAIQTTKKSLEAAKKEKDTSWIEDALHNIAFAYTGQKKFDLAQSYLDIALQSAEIRQDEEALILFYASKGSNYAELKNFPKAIHFQKKALDIAAKRGSKIDIALNTGNIGANMFHLLALSKPYKPDSFLPADRNKLLAKSIDYLREGVRLCKEMNYVRGITFFTDGLKQALKRQRSNNNK